MRLLLALLAPTLIAADTPVLFDAGRWEMKLEVLSAVRDGKLGSAGKVADAKKTKFECLTSPEALDPARYFMDASGSSCPVTGTTANGKVDIVSACGKGDRRRRMTAKGDFSRNAYTLNITADFLIDGESYVAEAFVKGRYIGVCTGEDETLK